MEGTLIVLGALLGNYFVGPIWGVNIVLYFLVVSAFATRHGHGMHRRLILYTVTLQLLISTAHACVSLADLIMGLTVTDASAAEYFGDDARSAVLAQNILYTLNAHIGDCFIMWRVYVLWGRRIAFVIPFIVLDTGAAVLGFLASSELVHMRALNDPHILWQTETAWVISLIVQGIGTLLIAWRIWSTPTVSVSTPVRWSPWTILWVVVESGCLYSAATLVAIVLLVNKPAVIDAAVAPLCHIAAFVPLTIILREHFKTKAQGSVPITVGAATTFLVDDRELDQRNGGRATPLDTMTIEIQTSTHKQVDTENIALDPKMQRKLQKGFLPVL